MKNVLFLCTGNSCRSQMAEGWLKSLWKAGQVDSAGLEAHGKNPRAIQVMAEAGIDISAQDSTRLTPDMLAAADVVVTVCGHADEQCPALPATTRKFHWPLPDPARAVGDDEEILMQFRAVRDDIQGRVQALVKDLSS